MCVQVEAFAAVVDHGHSGDGEGREERERGQNRTGTESRVATRLSWRPLSGLKGVQPPLPFGERTRDCSPGHAGIKTSIIQVDFNY